MCRQPKACVDELESAIVKLGADWFAIGVRCQGLRELVLCHVIAEGARSSPGRQHSRGAGQPIRPPVGRARPGLPCDRLCLATAAVGTSGGAPDPNLTPLSPTVV